MTGSNHKTLVALNASHDEMMVYFDAEEESRNDIKINKNRF